MKKILFILLVLSSTNFAQFFETGQAKGLFLDIAVGPRFPVGSFSDNSNLGVGAALTISYTDNKILPVFLYGRIGYQHYPGSQDLYKSTNYASFSSNLLVVQSGIRYYFPPFIKDMVLLMPVIEGGFSFGYFEKAHIFQIGSGVNDFTEEVGKVGGHIGGGFSMFLLDVMVYYNYFQRNQYISADIKIRIPIYAII
jgi:hypothetical protein